MAAMLATKIALQAVKRIDKVPDKYWERMPGMRPPKTEEEYKETKAKVDKDEREHGRYGSDRRKRDDKRRDEKNHDNGRHRQSINRHRHDRDDHDDSDDRHRTRRRSQSDERRGSDKRRERDSRAERKKLDRRASSYSPAPPSDDEFYNDAERRRQQRRAHKYHCNDPSHQQWERRDSPAYMTRPYVPMPQPGVVSPSSAQMSPPGSAGGPNSIPTYNPAAYPPVRNGQQVPLPRPPQGPTRGAAPAPYTNLQSPPDSRRSSAQVSTSFSPQASSPYMPASAATSRPISQDVSASAAPPFQPQYRYPASATATQPMPVPQQQQPVFSPPPVQQQQHPVFSPPPVQKQVPSRTGTPGVVSPPSSIASANSSSRAAHKYTPEGVAMGNPMYATP